MSIQSPLVQDSRRYASAVAHRDAHPRKKKAAFDNGVTVRTERRWGSPREAAGSPQDQYSRYLTTAQDPWRLLAHNRVTVMQNSLARLSRREIIDRIRELHMDTSLQDGVDQANRHRSLGWLDRAADTERAAAKKEELAALYRRASELRIPESEVFGS